MRFRVSVASAVLIMMLASCEDQPTTSSDVFVIDGRWDGPVTHAFSSSNDRVSFVVEGNRVVAMEWFLDFPETEDCLPVTQAICTGACSRLNPPSIIQDGTFTVTNSQTGCCEELEALITGRFTAGDVAEGEIVGDAGPLASGSCVAVGTWKADCCTE